MEPDRDDIHRLILHLANVTGLSVSLLRADMQRLHLWLSMAVETLRDPGTKGAKKSDEHDLWHLIHTDGI